MLLQPSDVLQRESLISAMTEILWKAGNMSKVTIVLPCLDIVIEPPLTFTFDGITEKLNCFYCYSEEETLTSIKKYIHFVRFKICKFVNFKLFVQFMNEKNGGLLCYLYSIVLSKGFEKYFKI